MDLTVWLYCHKFTIKCCLNSLVCYCVYPNYIKQFHLHKSMPQHGSFRLFLLLKSVICKVHTT